MSGRNIENSANCGRKNRRQFLRQSAGVGLGLGAVTGVSTEAHAQTNGGSKIWSFVPSNDGSDYVRSAPTVVDGTAYFGTCYKGSAVYAVNISDGSQKWKLSLPNDEIQSSPTVVNGTLYIGSNDGTVYAVDADSATPKWSFDINTDDMVFSSPTVWKTTVYFGSGNDDATLYAVNAITGEKEWEYTDIGGIFSSPLVHGGTVYVGSNTNELYAVDASSGEKEWTFETGADIRSSPTIADGTIYIGSDDNNLYAIDAATGVKKWSFTTGDSVVSSPTVVDNTVFVGSKDGFLYAIKADSGIRRWGFETDGQIGYGSPTVADGTAFIGSEDDDGTLYAIDTESGDEEWAAELPQTPLSSPIKSSPVVVDGTVYVGANADRINYDEAMFAVDAGVSGSSEGSRIKQGVLGQHGDWAEKATATAPVAHAGDTQTVPGGEEIVLDGTKSGDPNGDSLTYTWSQTGGPEVSLTDPNSEITTCTAPDVDSDTELGFKLTVGDGEESDTDKTTVTVTYTGPPPVTGDKNPTDPNDDGLYEDINGDGVVNIFDVQALFDNLESDPVQNNPAAFNFAGDENPDSVDIFDVQALFETVQAQDS